MSTKRCYENIHGVWDLLEVANMEFSEVIQIFSITIIKIHWIVHFRCMSFIVYEFYFKTFFKKPTTLSKCQFFPNLIYRYCVIPKDSSKLFCGHWKTDYKVFMEMHKIQNSPHNMEEQIGGWTLHGFNTYCKNYSNHHSVLLVRKHTDLWNRRRGQE